jgi:hypothetical protein
MKKSELLNWLKRPFLEHKGISTSDWVSRAKLPEEISC